MRESIHTDPRARDLPAPARRALAAPSQLLAALLLTLGVALAGCSASDAKQQPPEEVTEDLANTECASYATAVASCLRSLGAPAEEVTARSTQTRDTFLARAHESAATASDVVAQCRANRLRLAAQCH